MADLESLNVNQRHAVDWNDGPLLVLAGRGAGKTRVLTTRMARLVQESPGRHFGVLGLTSTTKAAEEMRGRVAHLLGPNNRRVCLQTFHDFAADVLRQHGSHLGLRPDLTILNQEADRLLVLQDALDDAASAGIPPGTTARGVLPMVDRLLRVGWDGQESPDEPLPFPAPGKKWIRPVYRNYIRLLIEGNHLDFEALPVCCLRLFSERPVILGDYGIVFPFVCVDEYQDTNRVQDRLLRAIYPDQKANLLVAADNGQSASQWNGAGLDRVRRLQQDYDMRVLQLPESFRCPPGIVDLANKLIPCNTERAPDKKPLAPAAGASTSPVVRVRRFADCAAELSWVAADIRQRSAASETCVVLARNTRLVRAAAAALSANGVPSRAARQKAEFETPLLRFLYAALRLRNRPADIGQLAALCRAYSDLTGRCMHLEAAEAESIFSGEPLLAGFLSAAAADADADADGNTRILLDTLRDDLLDRTRYRDFFTNVLAWRDGHSASAHTDPDEEAAERATWESLTREIRQQPGTDPPLDQFLQQIDLRQKAPPPRATDVPCLTIHMARGREFQHVYLTGLAEEQLPSHYALQAGASAMEEERRTCFAAITRAASSLTLTHADSYFGRCKQPSRFLEEMGLHPANGAR